MISSVSSSQRNGSRVQNRTSYLIYICTVASTLDCSSRTGADTTGGREGVPPTADRYQPPTDCQQAVGPCGSEGHVEQHSIGRTEWKVLSAACTRSNTVTTHTRETNIIGGSPRRDPPALGGCPSSAREPSPSGTRRPPQSPPLSVCVCVSPRSQGSFCLRLRGRRSNISSPYRLSDTRTTTSSHESSST